MVVLKSPMSEPTEDEASAPLLPPPPPPPPPPPLPTMMSSAADEPRVLCVVRDMTNSEIQTKFTMNLPYTTTIRSLLKDIANRLGYINGTFLVSYERPTIGAGGKTELEEMTVNELGDQQLRDVCLHCGDRRRNNFNVMEKDDLPPTRAEPKLDDSLDVSTLTLGATASPIGESGSYSSSRPAENYAPSLPSDYNYSYGSTLIKSDTGYVGLVNQAMTCYLNSLLQTLYMTPEFRNAIYRWEFDGTEEEGARSIPYQLQRLFLQLQTSKRRAIETTDITKSFGWDSSESWQQHDVQELCRVMFDALEKKWRKTVQADLITRLYQGGLKDYVKCLECGYESARMDTYLDIPLVIRPFGANTSYSSVEEALKAFVQPEILDGNNQYFCERCDKKCNAHKGLKFTSFPYFLTMQLKRFDFDYTTMNRIKLNDKMTFPEILNLNRMLDDDDGLDTPPADPLPPKIIGDKGEDSPANDQLSDEGDEGIDVGYSTSGASVASVSDSSLNSTEAAVNDKNAQESLKRGPYEYELFSIMIHSGSAAGGHYYAYIKSFKDGQWYSFNDQHVTTITYDDIRKTYGGSNTSRGYYSSAFTSSTNGYMLMYRQIDKERNKDFMQLEEFPEHLDLRLRNLQGQEEAERRQRELDRCTCKIKLFCFHPVHQKQVEGKLEVHKDSSLHEATEVAWKQLELDDVVPLSGVRLVRYNELQDWVERSYEGEDDTPVGTLLGGVKSLYTFDLLMEVKRPDQKFLEYKPGGVTVKVCLVDLEDETISAPITFRAYLNQTVGDFKEMVAQVADIPTDRMRCVLERYYNELKLLLVPTKTLKSEGFVRSNKVFIECSHQENDVTGSFVDSRFYKLLDRYENTIRIYISLPPFDTADSPSAMSKSSSSTADRPTASDKSPDVDEGIDDNGSDVAVADEEDLQKLKDAIDDDTTESGSGGLRSQVLSSSDKQADVHTYISDTISHNLTKDTDGSPTSTSITGSAAHTASPDDNKAAGADSTTIPCTEDWDMEAAAMAAAAISDEEEEAETVKMRAAEDDEYSRYFTGAIHIDAETGDRNLTVYVDKRITFGAFKKELEPYVCASSDYFRVYRVYGSNQEIETVRLSDTLSAFGDDNKLVVKLGRALKKGEQRVKVCLLTPKEQEPWRTLLETIFPKGITVLESKKIVVHEARVQCNLNVPIDRCRLRKKTYKNPGGIYLNNNSYDESTQVISFFEIFLEILDEPDKMTLPSQLQLYVRRWLPSLYKLGPIQEVVLDKQTSQHLKQRLSELSEIPVDNIDFAKGMGVFPYEVSLLDVHSGLDWSAEVASLGMWPLHIYEDGNLIYYRDKTEELAELDEARKKELTQSENTRLSRISTKVTYSPRKEKALKIYTDDPPSPSPTSSSHLDVD